MADSEANRPPVLVDTRWVADHLDDPRVRIVEIDVDTAAYDTGHVPGALGWDWRRDLQRHPSRDIPNREQWESLLSRSGVGNDTTVILYGDNNNWFAAFGYWLFRMYGHGDVRLMDGSRKKWLEEGRPTTTDVPRYAAAEYHAAAPKSDLRALRGLVQGLLGQPNAALVDVRSPGEYRGDLLAPENLPQEGAQRGGHIPGAANIPWATVVAEDGTFKPREELVRIYQSQGVTPDKNVVAYCRIGERSAHTWFVLHELLGYANVRNYDGSWTEWGSLIGAPVQTGDER
ncbi:MAG TPA: sulfurtransferase [Thermomicrobiaceae bacterium]|nr:sulfurtransferase [Thermomicrobiaceae bacterium]